MTADEYLKLLEQKPQQAAPQPKTPAEEAVSKYQHLLDNEWKGFGHTPEPRKQGFVNSFLGSFRKDVEPRAQFYAERLFPNDPNAISRFTVRNGELSYISDEGQLVSVDEGKGLGDWAGKFLGENALPIVGGIAGAFGGGPPGAAVGAAVGELVERGIGGVLGDQMLVDSPKGKEPNPKVLKAVVGEGLFEYLGGVAGQAVGKIVGRSRIRELDGVDVQELKRLQDSVFSKTGIRLDAAQLSNSPYLRQLKTFAANYPGETQDLIRAFDDLQRGQADSAIEKILDATSRNSSPELQGKHIIDAGQAAIALAKEIRRGATEPLYKQAFMEPMKPISRARMREFLDSPLIKQAYDAVKKDPVWSSELENYPVDSVARWDFTKRILDDMAETAARSGNMQRARAIRENAIRPMTKALDELTDAGWQNARRAYNQLTTDVVAPLENSVIGLIAELPTAEARTASSLIVSGKLPGIEQVRYAKTFIKRMENQGKAPEGAWGDVVRQYLQNNMERAATLSKDGKSQLVDLLPNMIAGNPRQKQALMEMMGEDGYKSLMDVFGAARKISQSNVAPSQTAFMQMLDRKFGSQFSSAVRWVLAPRQTILSAMDSKFAERNAGLIAEAVIDPTKIDLLRKLQPLPESAEKAFVIMGIVLGQPTRAFDFSAPEQDIAPGQIGKQ